MRLALMTSVAAALTLTAGAVAAQDTMSTTTPAPAGLNAPSGEQADTVTTVASPPVHNPTDGQVDGMPGAHAPSAGPAMPAPSDGMTPMPAPAPMTSTAPAPIGLNAPNGMPASSVTTVASPPVPNPTDGQVDGMADPNVPNPPVLPDADGTETDNQPDTATPPAPQG